VRVLYDGFVSPEPRSGIERYFTMLVMNMPENVEVSCSVRSGRRRGQIGIHEVDSPPFPLFRPRRFCGFLNKMCWLSREFDILHWVHYGPSQIAERLRDEGIPYVVTVHDLIHEIYGAPNGLLDRQARQRSYDQASAIICVSDNTRKDLLKEYELDADKVHVVHHGSSIHNTSSSEVSHHQGQYFLYVGPRSGYKNFPALFPGLKAVLVKYPQIKLRIVGNFLSEEEKAEIKQFGLREMVIEEGRVNDDRLSQLYRSAIALLHPSLHEGFGIPLVEAMSCGTVPIATHSTCVPEVVGDAGIHVDPSRVEDGFRDAMLELLSDPNYREHCLSASRERAKAFSWECAASKTMEIYSKVLNK